MYHYRACSVCGSLVPPEQLAEGVCVACFAYERGRIVIDPVDYVNQYLTMEFELAQLREFKAEAFQTISKLRQENVKLRNQLGRLKERKNGKKDN